MIANSGHDERGKHSGETREFIAIRKEAFYVRLYTIL